MAQLETFEVSQDDVTVNIDVPNPEGLDRAALMPRVAEAFQAYRKGQNAPPAEPADRSLTSDFRAGASQAVTGFGKTGALLADKAANSGFEPVAKAGRWFQENAPNIQGSIAAPGKNYKPAGEDLAQNIRDGNYADMPWNILRSGVASIAPGAAVIAGGAVGNVPGALATSAAMNLGDNVEAAGGDVLTGAAATVPQAILDTFGVRGFGKAIDKVPTAVARAGLKTGREAVGQGGGEALKEGILHGEIDPANVGAAALAGGASRGILEVPGLAKAGLKSVGEGAAAGAENLMSRYGVEQPKTAEEGRAYQVAADHILEAKRIDVENGQNSSDTQIANNALTTLRTQALETLRRLRDGGAIERSEFAEINTGLQNAGKHNSTHLGEGDNSFHVIDRAEGLDANSKQSLKDLIAGIETLSGSSLQKRTVGPAESLGTKIGRAGSVAAGLAHGSPHGVVAGIAGNTLGGHIGGGVGRMLDKALNLSKPDVLYKAKAADRLFGKGDAPSLNDHLENLNGSLRDPETALFKQIRQKRTETGGPEIFDPADTAGATPDQKGRWADAMDQAKTEDVARTTATAAAEKVSAKAQAKTDAEAAAKKKAEDALKTRPMTETEKRAYAISDAKHMDRQKTKAELAAETATKRSKLEAAQSATADIAERERYSRDATKAEARKQTQLAKAQAFEAEAKAKREAGATKAEQAKSSQDAATKKAQEDAAWAMHKNQASGPDATASQVAGFNAETRALAKAQALAAKGAPFDPSKSPTTTPKEGPAYDHMRRDAEAMNKGTEAAELDELGRPVDPVPVNTPIKGGRGLKAAQALLEKRQPIPKLKTNAPDALDIIEQMADAKAAPGKPSEAPGPTSSAEAPKAAPAQPQARPDGYGEAADTHAIAEGPLAYAAISLNGRDSGILGNNRASAGDVREAIGHLLENGTLARMLDDPSKAPELAHAIQNGHVPAAHPMSKAIGRALILQVAKNKGVLDEVAYRRPEGETPKTMAEEFRSKAGEQPRLDAEGKPIRSIDAYNNAAKAYHEQIAAQIKTAQEQGFPKLATALDKISAVSGLIDKMAVRTPYINALREAAKRGTKGAKDELTHALTALDFKGMAMKGKMPKGPQ